ncbi:Na+/H+ antiporter NhaA [Candidatus Saccharibacteria bacterium]|nr:MAG: Na+/H+ antiporter NhaA [Candidatus Saccharibacteria bacterium]
MQGVLGSLVSDRFTMLKTIHHTIHHHIRRAVHATRIPAVAAYLLRDEAISGKFILGAVALALLCANTALASWYEHLWHTELSIGLGSWSLTYDLQHWVNEALMAIFFLVVGLEIKRELVRGDLRHRKTALLPIGAALGGMVVPALLYLAFTHGTATAQGWAIPMATDIALAVGVLSIVGKYVPASLKLFLLTLAIVDDIGAILVIGLFYGSGFDPTMLLFAGLVCMAVVILGRKSWLPLWLYMVLGVALWLALQAGGVHASIAGALLGLATPIAARHKPGTPELAERVERHAIPWSTLVIVPIFVFANTGVALSLSGFSEPGAGAMAAGILAGLCIGKVVGIVGTSWLLTRLGWAKLPTGSTWRHIGGAGFVAGIGFTVSIFVTELAFGGQPEYENSAKLSIFAASILSALVGLVVLRRTKKVG